MKNESIYEVALKYLNEGNGKNIDTFLGFYHENDIETLAITYLEENGCDVLGTSLENIQKSGADFLKECIHPNDLLNSIELLNDFASKKNEQETLTYIQRVKIAGTTNYVPYFTCVKLNLTRSVFLCTTLPLTNIHEFQSEVNHLLEEANYIDKNMFIFNSFSKREKEVITLVCKGMTAQQIGEHLFLSPFTIEKHKKNIYKKGCFETNADLIKFALNYNLI